MTKWTIGVVGAGSIAGMHAEVISEMANCVFAGCCDSGSGSGRAKHLCDKYGGRVYADYQSMMDDPTVDIATIATPSGFHYEPTIAAALSGKHVLCEKPLEISLERIDSMIAAHQTSGTYLGCIFQNRFTDSMSHLRGAIDQDRFGTITFASIHVPWWRGQEYYDGTWRGTWQLDGGGAMMNQSIHLVDMLCELMGPVAEIKSLIGTLGHSMEAEDTAAAVVRFESGTLGTIYGSTASWPGRPRRFEITGTRGTAVYVDDRIAVWEFAEALPEDKTVLESIAACNAGGGASDPMDISCLYHRRNFEAFIDAIEGGGPFELDGREARKSVDLILRLYQAASK
jgi:predicted dehydrogenase